jgi:oxidase EvaA
MEDRAYVHGLPADLGLRPEMGLAIHASRGCGVPIHDDTCVDEWVRKQRANAGLDAMLVPLKGLDGWQLEMKTGNLCHATGRFFSVIGIHCRHRVDRFELEWDQPVIEQPETGVLGILAKSIGGVMHFCLQAKEEPGNIGGVQLSPTVQATYSNYTGAHGGAAPLFLEHFITPAPERIIFARLQTEDGGRFLYKSNRNMIVDGGRDFPLELPDGFIWLTLRQIACLLRRDNLVNACTRSILSSLIFTCTAGPLDEQAWAGDHSGPPVAALAGIWETLHWLDDRRAGNHMLACRIGLNELQEWGLDEKGFFSHREKRFFRIVGMRITSAAREVGSWCQPIIENPAPGVIGLLVRNGPQGIEMLMQAKAEAGNKTTVQLGPTVQFTQGNYADSPKLKKPFLYDEFLVPGPFGLIHESRQAEEGARFYRECHVHRVLMLPDSAYLPLPDDYRWLPLSHVLFLVHLGEQVNSCARSILTCLL